MVVNTWKGHVKSELSHVTEVRTPKTLELNLLSNVIILCTSSKAIETQELKKTRRWGIRNMFAMKYQHYFRSLTVLIEVCPSGEDDGPSHLFT